MQEIDLKDLIHEALVELSARYDQSEPYKYLETASFLSLSTDLAFELEQRGVLLSAESNTTDHEGE